MDLDSPTDAPATADEEDYAFAIDHVHNSTSSSSPDSAHAQVMLNDVAAGALIDSGASCNLLGKAQLRELRQRGLRVDLKKNGIKQEYECETGVSQPDARSAEGCDTPRRTRVRAVLIPFLTCTLDERASQKLVS